jgi:hypothetical protein
MSASDKQIDGNHYRDLGDFQPWDVMKHWLTPDEYRGYQKGTAIAYLARERSKGGDKDIAKAAHHLEKLLEVLAEQKATPAQPEWWIDRDPEIEPEFRSGTRVVVKLRNGRMIDGVASNLDWELKDHPADIIAYKIIPPNN